MVSVRFKGSDFKNTEKLLRKSFGRNWTAVLEKCGEQGVAALSNATPVDTGLTAASWSYEIIQNDGGVSIIWNNSNVQNHVNIALILQYGHGTRNGGYVQGRDYINPAMRPIFDEMAEKAWKEVVNK